LQTYTFFLRKSVVFEKKETKKSNNLAFSAFLLIFAAGKKALFS